MLPGELPVPLPCSSQEGAVGVAVTETPRRQRLGQDTCPRVHRYAVSSMRGLKMIFCFLLIRLTNFAFGITRQNPRAHILLSQDDWALELYQQAKTEEGRAFSFYPVHMLLKAEEQLATKSCMMNIFLQIFSLSCFDEGIPVQLGETHKTKAVHFHMERSRNHLSAMSFPASAVQSSTTKLCHRRPTASYPVCKGYQLYILSHMQTGGYCQIHQGQRGTAWKMLQF